MLDVVMSVATTVGLRAVQPRRERLRVHKCQVGRKKDFQVFVGKETGKYFRSDRLVVVDFLRFSEILVVVAVNGERIWLG